MCKIVATHTDSLRVVLDSPLRGNAEYETWNQPQGFYPFFMDATWTDGILNGVYVTGRLISGFSDHTDRKHIALRGRTSEEVRLELHRLHECLPGMLVDLCEHETVTAYLSSRKVLSEVFEGQRTKVDVPT